MSGHGATVTWCSQIIQQRELDWVHFAICQMKFSYQRNLFDGLIAEFMMSQNQWGQHNVQNYKKSLKANKDNKFWI